MNSKLIDQLRVAFPATPLPARVLLDEKDHSEFSEDIRLQFTCKLWTSVTLDNWANTAGIEVMRYYMTAEAFHYYLPSLLFISLSTGEYIDWGFKSILPHNNSREPKGEWWENYFSCFDDKQKKFIQEYILQSLESVRSGSEEEYLAQVALEKIWV